MVLRKKGLTFSRDLKFVFIIEIYSLELGKFLIEIAFYQLKLFEKVLA